MDRNSISESIHLDLNKSKINKLGEVAEWSNVPDSKSGVPQGTEGSNPSFSANFFRVSA